MVPLQSVHAFASISCTINNHASRVFDHRTVELAPLVLSAPDKVGLAGANDVVGQTPRLLSIFNIFTREDADIQLVLPPVALKTYALSQAALRKSVRELDVPTVDNTFYQRTVPNESVFALALAQTASPDRVVDHTALNAASFCRGNPQKFALALAGIDGPLNN